MQHQKLTSAVWYFEIKLFSSSESVPTDCGLCQADGRTSMMHPPKRSNAKYSRNQGSEPKPSASSPCSTAQNTLMSPHFPITFTSFLSDAGSRAGKRQRQWKPVPQIFLPRTKFQNCPSPGSLPTRYTSVSRWRTIPTLHQDLTSSREKLVPQIPGCRVAHPPPPFRYSAATCAPFSATERFMNNTRKASRTPTTANMKKQSK